jgi:hypothetical protein
LSLLGQTPTNVTRTISYSAATHLPCPKATKRSVGGV